MTFDLSSFVPSLGVAFPTWPAATLVTLVLGAATLLLARVRALSSFRVPLVSLLSFLAPLALFLVVNVLPRTEAIEAAWVTVAPVAFVPPLLAPLLVSIAARRQWQPSAQPIAASRRLLVFLCTLMALVAAVVLFPFASSIGLAPGLLLMGPVFPSGHHHYAHSLPHFVPLAVILCASAWAWSLAAVEVYSRRRSARPA